MKTFALFSVSDKTGIDSLAAAFIQNEFALLATGGTYKFLKQKGFEVTEVAELTGEPERFDGRLKTLTPKILGAIMFRPGIDDFEWKENYRIGAVVCNFYPFEEQTKSLKDLPSLIEWIDIGGPNMVRAAAKNYEHVWVFSRSDQYARYLAAPEHGLELRARFALEAFERVAEYGQKIVEGFQRIQMGSVILGRHQEDGLKYGENPHQKATFHPNRRVLPKFLGDWSYNNIRDADAAVRFVSAFRGPAVAVVKHQNICGAACALDPQKVEEVFHWAWEGDDVSRFGGVIALNFDPPKNSLEVFRKKFIEVIVMPRSLENERSGSELLKIKERLKVGLLDFDRVREEKKGHEVWASILGKLEQQFDRPSWELDFEDHKSPIEQLGEWAAACSKSNAIVLCSEKNGVAFLCGAGQGQPNRVDALEKLALPRARKFAERMKVPLAAMTCFSDGFFPFSDAIEILAQQGVKKVYHPGGAKADAEVLQKGLSLGVEVKISPPRHFWH